MNKRTSIIATIGLAVWYIPSIYDRGGMLDKPSTIMHASSDKPCEARIAYVHSERLVNLSVTDHNGNIHQRTSVTLYQPGDDIPVDSGFAVWKEDQVKQAEPKLQGSTTAKYFAYGHLPAHLQTVSQPVGQLAELLELLLPNGPEKSAGMRKLLEAKDCFVRAALDLPAAELLAKAPITDSDRLDVLFRGMTDTLGPLDGERASNAFEEVFAHDEDLTREKLNQVLDKLIALEREPKQHTEDADHFEG